MTRNLESKCRSCNTILKGDICHVCGQKVFGERWSVSAMISQFFQQLTNIEKGFLYTSKCLFTNPGSIVHNYWNGSTIKYYNPFRYVLFWVAVNLLVSFYLGIDDLLQDYIQPAAVDEKFGQEKIEAADQTFDTWLNAMVLLLLPIFSLLTQYLFVKKKNNYAEHLIMNAYIMGQQSLITSFTQFIFYLFPGLLIIYLPFNFLVGLVYNTYVFKKVFNEGFWVTLAKAFLIGIVGLLVFGVVLAVASMVALRLS